MTCRACRCGFCTYCSADCGEDAHTHVAGCQFNTANRNVFPPGAHNPTPQAQQQYFEGVQRVCKTRQITEEFFWFPFAGSIDNNPILAQVIGDEHESLTPQCSWQRQQMSFEHEEIIGERDIYRDRDR
jgi:hypothetical protein